MFDIRICNEGELILNRVATFMLFVLTTVLLCSCQKYRMEDAALRVPDTFSHELAQGTVSPELVQGWESFHEPELNRLIRRLLADNPGLRQAWARLEQAGAMADQAAASSWPVLTTNIGAGRSRSNVPSASGTSAAYANQFSTSAAASYELDLWGRISASDKAAKLNYEASRSDAEAMSVSLIAELAETWFSIIEQKALLHLLGEQLKVSETYLKLTKLRFGHGEASALDVYQQHQQVIATRAQTPLLESKLQVLLHKLAVLMGQPPRSLIAKPHANLPNLPSLPSAGLPLTLLKKRPDIRAAQLRLAAADQKTAAAIADSFPSLRLSASAGFRASKLAELFENMVWDVLGNLSGTLWDRGRKSAEVRRNRAVMRERAALYVQTALRAFQEVEDALVLEAHQRAYIEKLDTQTALARKSLEESRIRYLNGLNDYLRVLTALKSVQLLEQNLISAKKLLLSHRIRLYRALGVSL